MKDTSNQPRVQRYNNEDWEFIYPPSMDNEKVNDEFWYAVELLDHDDNAAEHNFKKLIAEHPWYIDAYNHLSLAFRNQSKTFESLLTAEKAFNLGKSCLPESFDLKKDHLIWGNLDNRPFLRACQIYGLECQRHKNYAEAIELYQMNLALNKNDNQGIRYLLLEVYFAAEDYKRARLLLDKYREDFSIEFTFGSVALSVLEGSLQKADATLRQAVETNKFFIGEVIKTRHVEPEAFRLPGEPNFDAGIPIGSVQQAFDYWKRNEQLYRKKEVVDYFRKVGQ